MPTKFYPQNANADTNCDLGTSPGPDNDLSTTQGTSTTINYDVSTITALQDIGSFQMDVSGVSGYSTTSGTYDYSLSVNSISNAEGQVYMACVDRTGCLPGSTSSVDPATPWTTSGTKTGSWTFAIKSGDEDLMFVLRGRETKTHGGRSITIDVQDANTWLQAWWPSAVTVKTPMIMGWVLWVGLWVPMHYALGRTVTPLI